MRIAYGEVNSSKSQHFGASSKTAIYQWPSFLECPLTAAQRPPMEASGSVLTVVMFKLPTWIEVSSGREILGPVMSRANPTSIYLGR